MKMNIYTIFGIFFLLVIMQFIGMRLQIKAYREAVRRLHQEGNLGIGSRRGRIGSGYIIIIACDNEGTIIDSEIMKGMTIFSRFKKEAALIGKNISAVKRECMAFPKQKRKQYKGYIQALEALEIRLKLPESQEV